MTLRRMGSFKFQALVFALVSAAFTAIYLTQPVLPVIGQEFGFSTHLVALMYLA